MDGLAALAMARSGNGFQETKMRVRNFPNPHFSFFKPPTSYFKTSYLSSIIFRHLK